jgi:DNA-directed RNA polymerase subunit N (RpoN/RPB10)
MASFIRCPECANCLGIYVDFVHEAKNKIYQKEVFEKHSDYDPEKLCIKPDILPDLSELLDALELKNTCCRMHILTKVNIDKIYE